MDTKPILNNNRIVTGVSDVVHHGLLHMTDEIFQIISQRSDSHQAIIQYVQIFTEYHVDTNIVWCLQSYRIIVKYLQDDF